MTHPYDGPPKCPHGVVPEHCAECGEPEKTTMNAVTKHEAYAVTTTATPAQLLQIAVQQGAAVEQLERLMALQERYQAAEAKRQYDEAFAAFKAEGVRLVRNKTVTQGPLKGGKYAELWSIIDVVTPALSKHGLSTSWKLTKDDKDWLEVTCYLKHVAGHVESASMGGPPDSRQGDAKSPIQARASSKTFLERYTLKAVLGLAEAGDDDLEQGGGAPALSEADTAALALLEAAAEKGEKALQAAFQSSAISDAAWKANRGRLVSDAKQVDKLAGRR